MKEKLYTVAQVSEYLSVTEQTVRRWIRVGKLPAIKLDRELRIQESDLEAFLNARRTPVKREE